MVVIFSFLNIAQSASSNSIELAKYIKSMRKQWFLLATWNKAGLSLWNLHNYGLHSVSTPTTVDLMSSSYINWTSYSSCIKWILTCLGSYRPFSLPIGASRSSGTLSSLGMYFMIAIWSSRSDALGCRTRWFLIQRPFAYWFLLWARSVLVSSRSIFLLPWKRSSIL